MHLQRSSFPNLIRSMALPLLGILVAMLCACSTPSASRSAVVYDFGPGTTQPAISNRMAPLPPLLLADIEANAALEGTAVLYRLAYADAQQLRPYAQARWSMSPSSLLRLRLRELLGQRRPVLLPTDVAPPGTLVLRLELEEFSHYFASAQSSAGLVRVRATLGRTGSPAKVLAQTSFVVQQPATTADAAGGVRAIAQASDAMVGQIDNWVQQVANAETVVQ